MRKFRGDVSIGLVGCKREFEFEVEEGTSDKEIDDIAQDAAFQYIDWYYEEVDG